MAFAFGLSSMGWRALSRPDEGEEESEGERLVGVLRSELTMVVRADALPHAALPHATCDALDGLRNDCDCDGEVDVLDGLRDECECDLARKLASCSRASRRTRSSGRLARPGVSRDATESYCPFATWKKESFLEPLVDSDVSSYASTSTPCGREAGAGWVERR